MLVRVVRAWRWHLTRLLIFPELLLNDQAPVSGLLGYGCCLLSGVNQIVGIDSLITAWALTQVVIAALCNYTLRILVVSRAKSICTLNRAISLVLKFQLLYDSFLVLHIVQEAWVMLLLG